MAESAAAHLLRWALPFYAAFACGGAHACTQASATYMDRDGVATVQFAPNRSGAITVSNTFSMTLGPGLVLDGIVMWSVGIERPDGQLMFKCPQGDVTGDELRRCTLWQGVVYTIDKAGTVGLLPAESAPAAETLLFSDLGWSLAQSPGYGPGGFTKVPFDVFALKGCKE